MFADVACRCGGTVAFEPGAGCRLGDGLPSARLQRRGVRGGEDLGGKLLVVAHWADY